MEKETQGKVHDKLEKEEEKLQNGLENKDMKINKMDETGEDSNQLEQNEIVTQRNDNRVNVNNNFNLSIHLGDSLNLLALVAGLFIIKTVAKKYKRKEKKGKWVSIENHPKA